MQLATAMNLRKAMDEETKRERFASWYSTLPGIPAHEKEIIERSLKYTHVERTHKTLCRLYDPFTGMVFRSRSV